MRRRSTGLASVSTGSNTENEKLTDTGLRPCWDEFWQLSDVEPRTSTVKIHPMTSDSRTCTVSTISTLKSESTNFRNVKFISGSEWIGEWDRLGMGGMGVYKMPHGVVYEGSMNNGEFEGVGVLTYPNGTSVEGFWHEGRLKYCHCEYGDGLKRESPVGWAYCQMPDRRFHSEVLHGLRPSGREQMTSEEPSREVPPGLYDVGDGFYNPRTKCVTDPATGEVLRIPTSNEEKWILVSARSADVGNVGYRPDLYENWFKTRDLDKLAWRELTEGEKEILAMIWQEEGNLEPRGESWTSSHDRSTSLQSKVDSLREVKSTSSIWSRSTELEGAVRKLMKERCDKRSSNLPNLLQTSDPEMRESDEYSIVKLLHDIALSFSGQIDRVLYQTPSKVDLPELKPVPSDASVSTKPFSLTYPPPASEVTPQKVPRSVSDEFFHTKSSGNLDSESSHVRLDIDYTEYSVDSASGVRQDSI